MTSLDGPRSRIVMHREDVDRMIMMRMDLDRYEAQLIPDLHERVRNLTLALEGLVAAARDVSPNSREEALAIAQRVLAKEEDSNGH
jgi:hypothetical protein